MEKHGTAGSCFIDVIEIIWKGLFVYKIYSDECFNEFSKKISEISQYVCLDFRTFSVIQAVFCLF